MTSSNPAESAQHAALGWLSNGEHSASAVHDRLTKAGYETSVAKSVVSTLVANGSINDARCAESLIHGWTRSSPLAPGELKRRLAARGIHGDIALEAIGAITGDDVLAMALDAAAHKLRTMTTLSKDVAARRMAGHLARRGFDEDTTRAVLEHLDLCSTNE